MPDYRRFRVQGGCYFFTVNLAQRHRDGLLIQHIEELRNAVSRVKQKRSFHIDGWVVLPDHMHCLWTLPPGDDDFATRWRLIKTFFSRGLLAVEPKSGVGIRQGERGIWQRRYWEHAIRNARDYEAHMDYLHYNPVKHGYVNRVADWPYSTFSRCVGKGIYPADWGGDGVADIDAGEAVGS
jgi:putative transposase